MKKKAINAPGEAPPAGPYSAAIVAGGLVYVSGQVPRDPDTRKISSGPVGDQARLMLSNTQGVLNAAGIGFEDVLKSTLFLTDMADFVAVNAAYAEFFVEPWPARSTVEISALPLGARMEIELTALAKGLSNS